MDSLKDDIIKYKKGELSPKEMHALEKRALNDSFLAEALEGIENISTENLESDVAEINQRITEKKRRILVIPLRIAAGVALVAGSVFLFYELTPKRDMLALKTEKQKTPIPAPKADEQKQPMKEEEKKSETGTIAKVDLKKLKQESPKPQAEELKPRENQPQVAETKALGEAVKVADEEQQIVADQVPVVAEQIKQAPVPEISATESKSDKKKENFGLSRAAQGAGLSQKIQGSKSISGKVISAEDGSPLPGVNVIIEGTTEGTTTDANGEFIIKKIAENQRLTFSFIGLQQEEVDVTGKDKLDDVKMEADVTQLNEVVVVGYAVSSDKNEEPEIQLANPIGGRKAYNKYLETNQRYPEEALKNNIKGKVRVEFLLHPDGSFDDYKIIKSLGYGCDEELVRLIKTGPKWTPTTENGRPVESKVLVGLRFNSAKAGK